MTTLIPKFEQPYSNTVNRPINLKFQESVSVLDFGAVADGNTTTGAGTDNSPFFQAAINALGAGGCLYIPPGIYQLHSQVTVPSNFQIVGSGIYSTTLTCPNAFNSDGLIKFNGAGGPPTEIINLNISAQLNGAGASSIGLNMAANGSFASNIWVGGFKTGVKLSSSSSFFYNSVCDIGVAGGTGINITSGSTIVSNVQVYANYVGVSIYAPFGDAPVTLNNVQTVQCGYIGISIDTANNVQVNNCSACSAVSSANFGYGGIVIANSSNVDISNFVGKLTTQQTTGNGGIYSINSTSINISNSQITNYYDGININNGGDITINGNNCSNNYHYGISVSACDRTIVSNNNCNADGSASTTDAGIYSNNSLGYQTHNIVGNICSQTGGGVQEYGIYANVTNNGASTGFTNIVGNICKYNSTANISTNGVTGNITSTGNVT